MKNAVVAYEGAVTSNLIPGSEFFQLTSSRLGPLAVSPLGYLLLEALDGALGTTEQKVEWVVFDYFAGPWLKASLLVCLVSRGTEGWIEVRKLVSSTQVKHLVCCKNSLVEDRRVDLKAICNCLTEMFYVRCKDFGYRYEKTSDDEDTAPGSTTEEEDRMPAKKTIRIITKTLRAKE